MSYFFFIGFLLGSFVLPGCSPALNWRDVRLDQTPLQALFPCKPERAAREVTLGDQVLTLNLLACDVGDAKFALAFADTADASGTGALLAQWRRATLANMRATTSHDVPADLKSLGALAPTASLLANGLRPDGRAVALQTVYFAVGARIFQASVYSDTAQPQVAETFFSGLRYP